MASLDVLNWDKGKKGTVSVSDNIFEAEPRKDILYDIVKWQLASRRQGTHKAKSRSEVSGTGAKPFKQKGTGRARQGSFQSPLLEGGGVHFAKTPRDYSYNLNKKYKRAGLRSALTFLKNEGRLFVVPDMVSKDGKTNTLYKQLKQFEVSKAVLVDEKVDSNFARAARNIPTIRYYAVDGVNVYDLLRFNHLIITEAALKKLEVRCTGETK